MTRAFTLVVAAPTLELAESVAFFDPRTNTRFTANRPLGDDEPIWTAHRCEHPTLAAAADDLAVLTDKPVHVAHTYPDAALIIAAVDGGDPYDLQLWHRRARDPAWRGPGDFARHGLAGHSTEPMAEFGMMCDFARTMGRISEVAGLTDSECRQFLQQRLGDLPAIAGATFGPPPGDGSDPSLSISEIRAQAARASAPLPSRGVRRPPRAAGGRGRRRPPHRP